MEPTTSEWVDALKTLTNQVALDHIIINSRRGRHGLLAHNWMFVAERLSNGKLVANIYYKDKVYRTTTYYW